MEQETTNTEKQFGSLEDFEKKLGVQAEEPTNPAETPKEEVKSEEPVEEKKEDVAEEPAQEPKAEEKKEGEEPKAEEPKGEAPKEEPKQEETLFDITEINKRFSTEFEDEDSLKAALESSKRIGELEKQVAELEALKEENLTLRENLDPMKYFTSEDSYKIEQFKREFPDKVPDVAYKLFTQDVNQMPDKDMLAYNMMLDDPDLDYATALEVVDRDYGLEEGEEVDKVTAAKMRKDARVARNSVSSMKSQIKLPDKIDVDSLSAQQKELREKKQQQLSQGWKDVAKEVAGTLSDVVIKDDDGNEMFRYSVTKDFPADVVDQVADTLSRTGTDISEDAAKTAAKVMRQNYLEQNYEKILKAAIDNERAKAEEDRLKKQHNPGSDKSDPEPKKKDDDLNAKVASKIGGFVPRPFLET